MASTRKDFSAAELERRTAIWHALSSLFLDNEVGDAEYRWIIREATNSAYSLEETRAILWDEVFPVLEGNLRSPCGAWAGFPTDWLVNEIQSGEPRSTAAEQPWVASVIEWAKIVALWPSDEPVA